MTDNNKYDVFISVNSADNIYAHEIWEYLRNNGRKVFFADETLPRIGKSEYRDEIDNALDNSENLIVVASSNKNLNSKWVKAEWGMFLNEIRSERKNGNVISILIGSLKINDLPISLRNHTCLKFNQYKDSLLDYIGDGRKENKKLIGNFFIFEKEAKFLDDLEKQFGIKIQSKNFFSPKGGLISFDFTDVGITLNPNNNISGIGISGLKLKTIPKSISNLKELNTLILHDVHLKQIPDRIFSLPLSFLHLEGNNITEIPESIGKLEKVSYLNLAYNQISNIPNSISQINFINHLDISGNQITDINEFNTRINELIIEFNPIKSPINEIISFYNRINECYGLEFPLDQIKMAEVNNRDEIENLINLYRTKERKRKKKVKKLKKQLKKGISNEKGRRIADKLVNLSKLTEQPILELINIGYPAVKVLVELLCTFF